MKKSLTLFCTAVSLCLYAQNSVVFTNNGNFTVPSGINSLTIEVVGAGGNGGGNGGGGGGGGGYAKGVYNVVPGTVYNIVVGVAGSGPAAGTTSVSSLIQATGGANGTSVSNPNVGGGGAGGVGSGGTIANNSGGNGGGGYWTYFGGGGGGAAGPLGNGTAGGNTIVYTPGNCLTPGGSGGAGGGAPGGNGGKGAGFVDNFCNSANPAAPGQNYGGGGGGGNGNSSPAQTGAGGYCLIEYGACSPPPSPVLTSTGSALMVCSGSQASLTASGTGTVSWHASPSGTASLGTGSVFVTGSLTANTIFYIQDNSCAPSAMRTAVTVSVIPGPTVSINSPPQVFCTNQVFTLQANGAVTYTWNVNATGTVLTFTPPLAVNFVLAVTGTGTDGCNATATLAVSVKNTPTVSAVASPTMACIGASLTLNASGAATYSWSNGASSAAISTLMPPSGIITVTGTSADGCPALASVSVTGLALPVVSIVAADTSICIGSTVMLSGSGASTYTWLPGGVGPNLVVGPATASTYVVAGANNFGCRDTASLLVSVVPLPTISVSSDKSVYCRHMQATLTAIGAVSYTWNGSHVGSEFVFYAINPSTYSVTATDENGCVNTGTILIRVNICDNLSENAYTDLEIYPNPSDGHFVLKSEKKDLFFITDLSGKQLGVFDLDGIHEKKLDLSYLDPGIYFLRNSEGSGRRLIIQR